MEKCRIVLYLFLSLISTSVFAQDFDTLNSDSVTQIQENITIGVYESIDYRRDSLWGDSTVVAFKPGLEILANIELAEIYFYDEFVGYTSFETESLLSGQYRVKIVKTGYKEEEFTFYLDMLKRTVIKIELLPYVGQLILSGITSDTKIIANNLWIDNPRIKNSTTGDVVVDLPVGTNKVRLRRFGFTTEDFSTVISSTQAVKHNVIWIEADPEILDFDIIPRFGSFFTKSPQKIAFSAELNRPGTLTINLLNENGESLGTSLLTCTTARVSDSLETTTILTQGSYILSVQFSSDGKNVTTEKPFPVSSKNINRYQTTHSGLSGLLFVPSAKTLYPYSYAVSLDTVGYYDYSENEVVVPVFLSFRFSPYLNLEGSGNVSFSFEPITGDSLLDISTGCKYNIPIASDLFSVGAGVHFTYSGMLPEFTSASSCDPFSNTTGAALVIPLELQWNFFRILLAPELDITPFELSDKNVNSLSFEPFSGIDIYSTIRIGGEFHLNGFAVGLSGAFKTPGFVTGGTDWLGGYIGFEFGYSIPATILQINGLFFLELKKDGLETIGGGLSLGLLL